MTEANRGRPAYRKTPAIWLATGLGFGFSPFAPGTVGSLWGLALAWGTGQIPALGPLPAWSIQAIVAVAVCVAGIPLCTLAVRQMGGVKDPGAIVFDEIASFPITFFLVSPANLNCVGVLGCGFVLNRIFDILKPPPARQLESLPEGLGIMADDWIAGLYSCLCLHAVIATGLFDWLRTLSTTLFGVI